FFQAFALISEGQASAGSVQSLRGRPSDRALVCDTEDDSLFVLQHTSVYCFLSLIWFFNSVVRFVVTSPRHIAWIIVRIVPPLYWSATKSQLASRYLIQAVSAVLSCAFSSSSSSAASCW